MKFREYGKVKPVTLISATPRRLDMAIERLGQKSDIIDLQFAARTKEDGKAEYSALALVKVNPNKPQSNKKEV